MFAYGFSSHELSQVIKNMMEVDSVRHWWWLYGQVGDQCVSSVMEGMSVAQQRI